MKSYNNIQFNRMVKQCHKEFGKSEITTWSDYYQSMKFHLQELKRLNKLNEEKAETEAILEYCNQHSDSSNIKISISIVSLIFSIIAIIITMFLETTPEYFGVNSKIIALILTVSVSLIQLIIVINMARSIKLKNDAVYFKNKLNLIEEISSKENVT